MAKRPAPIPAKRKEAPRAKSIVEDSEAPRVFGIIRKARFGWGLDCANRRDRNVYFFKNAKAAQDLQDHLVIARPTGSTKQDRVELEILEDLCTDDDPRGIPLIALRANDIAGAFPQDVLDEAEAAKPPTLGDREDLRKIPLVTIDGEDARDFDDAVFAEPHGKGGWHLIVAIADVSHYVKTGSALDCEAFKRGNSTYLPDRVVPMLPEALSNDLCSLRPNVDRACMAAHMWISAEGELEKWRFTRGLMKSKARLTYNQVQSALDGAPDPATKPILESILRPLQGAYHCLSAARVRRGTLELNLPERKVLLEEDGTVKAIVKREQLEAHKLIEEFMIAANVAAAAQIEQKGGACLYRIHDKPSEIKQEVLRDFLQTLDISLAPGKQIHPRDLTHILEKTAGGPHAQVVNEVMLRSQSQAVYSPENIGHFGLALARYAHFTSPIRRYADLIVHRALVRLCGLGDDGLSDDQKKHLKDIGEHISAAERRSIQAERDAVDRYTSLFLSDRIDAAFEGRISGVSRYGLFVRLDETGADGIIPFKTLPRDYYQLVEKSQTLVGERHGRSYSLGQKVRVKLEDTDPLTGSLSLAILEDKPIKKRRN